MAELIKNAGLSLSTANLTQLFEVSNTVGSSAVVVSILVVNDTNPTDGLAEGDITVVITNNADVEVSRLAFNLVVPPNSSLELIKNKVFLTQGQKIKVQASDANTLDVTLSVLEVLND